MATLLQVGNYQVKFGFCYFRLVTCYLFGLFPGSCLAGSRTIWTLELSLLIEHNLDFFFQRHAAKQRIYGLAAHYTIIIVVDASVCASNQVFDTCFILGQGIFAEKAQVTLREPEPMYLFGWHRPLTPDMSNGEKAHELDALVSACLDSRRRLIQAILDIRNVHKAISPLSSCNGY